MTQYEELKQFVKAHPGTTRGLMRKKIPHITHENDLLKRLINSGDGYRVRVIDPYSGKETWVIT